MSRNRFLSFASFLLTLQGVASFSAPAARGSTSVPFAFHQGHSSHGAPTQRLHHDTRLGAFSLPTAFPGNFKVRNDRPSNYNHRHSASDWLYNVKSLPQSTVLREILNPVFTISVWGTIVSIIHKLLAQSGNKIIQKIARDMCIGGTPHSFLVSSLGLLLVFRTNSAYQRFAEGRKIWENILTVSRNVSRMVNLYNREIGPERKRRILNLTAAFPYLLRHHIREGCLCEDSPASIPEPKRLLLNSPPVNHVDTRHEGDKTLDGELQRTRKRKPCWVDTRKLPWSLFERRSLAKCARAHNRPLWVCDRIGKEMVNIPYGPNYTSRERLSMLGQVEKLTNAIGECERIHQTAVPLNYARHSLRSLTLWLLTLPFALIKDMGLLTGPIIGVVAWVLFGVYQIGYSIEDPFQGSLRLSILCDAIRRDVLGDSDSRDTAFDTDDTAAWPAEEDLSMEDLAAESAPQIPNYHDLPILTRSDDSADVVMAQSRLVKATNGSWSVVSSVESKRK